VLQNEYNLYDREVETNGVAEACARHGVVMAPYYALASGFLSGKYRSAADAEKSPRGASVGKKYVNDKGMGILVAMDEVARETGANLSAIAVAWLIRRPTVASAIASATSEAQFKDLIAGATLELSSAQMEMLDAAGA
jgi:aryl-alcohol dehydrogenase-like predicted oxidoreductase